MFWYPVNRLDPLFKFTEWHPVDDTYTMVESTNGYSVELILPGFSRDSVNVTAYPDRITISATRPEGRLRSVERTYQLPENVDPESVVARLQDGILTISISKLPSAQPRKIPVL